MSKEKSLDAYLANLALLRERLDSLQAHAVKHPEEIRWVHVRHTRDATISLGAALAHLDLWKDGAEA